jgi:hypothetical protein
MIGDVEDRPASAHAVPGLQRRQQTENRVAMTIAMNVGAGDTASG